MAGEIERLNRMRKHIVRIAFLGTFFGLAWMMLPYFKPTKYPAMKGFPRGIHSFYISFQYALIIWAATILVFMVLFWMYKFRLKKNPAFRSAVYDERVKLGWLRSYRVAFLCALSTAILWKAYEMVFSRQLLTFKKHLPSGPFLVLSVAVIALTGSFLCFNREAQDGG